MRGGLRLVLLIGVLVTAGCGGGGHQQVDAGHDAQTDHLVEPDHFVPDAPEPSDGPQDDVILPPDVGPTCDPLSGHVTGSLCMIDFDCACPRACVRLRAAPATGSCWMRCDPANNDPGTGDNPDCQSGETCLLGAADTGGCLPRGTLSGSFDVPVYQAPAAPASASDLGTAAVTLDVGLVGQMLFESGYGTTANDGTSDVYRLYLYPGSGSTVDWDKPLLVDFLADGSYAPGATYDLAASPAAASIEYHEYVRDLQVLTRDLLRALVPTGSVHLTAAGQGGRALATGTISSATAIEFESVLCSQDTTPCQ